MVGQIDCGECFIGGLCAQNHCPRYTCLIQATVASYHLMGDIMRQVSLLYQQNSSGCTLNVTLSRVTDTSHMNFHQLRWAPQIVLPKAFLFVFISVLFVFIAAVDGIYGLLDFKMGSRVTHSPPCCLGIGACPCDTGDTAITLSPSLHV